MRGYNFGAGPAQLPEVILREAAEEWLDWQQSGMSITEIGHRTEAFMALLAETEALLRDLLTIPSDYRILFLGGAARAQFGMVPLNLIAAKQQAAHVISGIWSKLAFEEGMKVSRAYVLASAEASNYRCAPSLDSAALRPETAYVYYTPNETINGIRIATPPKWGVPVVADMTSCLLSEPLSIRDYGLIFAGAQKNIGPAGLTVLIIQEALLERQPEHVIPTMSDYRTHAAAQSLYATPPTFNIYLAHKMFKWLQAEGGVAALYQHNLEKSKRLYDYIDQSSFYHCPVESSSRSLMNICFTLKDPALERSFLQAAEAQRLYALKGHKLVGGCRASLYNAMPMAGVEALITFMTSFEKNHSL